MDIQVSLTGSIDPADLPPGKDGKDGAPGKDGVNGKDGLNATDAQVAAAVAKWFAANPPAPVVVPGFSPVTLPGVTAKKVFAHYVQWFPVSIENAQPASDYYTVQWNSPTGEGGSYTTVGGRLRDRPLPRTPLTGDWKLTDVVNEITQAKSVGIDGFAVDIVIMAADTGNPAATQPLRLFNAAAQVGGFSILPMADMSGGALPALTNAQFVTEMLPYLKSAGAYKLSDGRPVLTAFSPESKTVAWWTTTLAAFKTAGVEVAFVPVFLSAASLMASWASVAYGFGEWGSRSPTATTAVNAATAHGLGKIWWAPICYQDNRPALSAYWETQNGEMSRNMWSAAISGNAEWVQLITWNDYAENTQIAPSVKRSWSQLDGYAYQLTQFKTGATPTIVRDALYISHRSQPFAAKPTYTGQTSLQQLMAGSPTPRDKVEVAVYATAPDTLTVTIGTVVNTQTVPAGFSAWLYPLTTGVVSAKLSRGTTVTSPVPVTNTPYVQDLQYIVAGSGR